jgi:hypothetical protein
MHKGATPEVLLLDKSPNTANLQDVESPTANRIHFLSDPIDATRLRKYPRGFRTLLSSFHHLNSAEARPPAA